MDEGGGAGKAPHKETQDPFKHQTFASPIRRLKRNPCAVPVQAFSTHPERHPTSHAERCTCAKLAIAQACGANDQEARITPCRRACSSTCLHGALEEHCPRHCVRPKSNYTNMGGGDGTRHCDSAKARM